MFKSLTARRGNLKSGPEWFTFLLRANGVEFEKVSLRTCLGSTRELEMVVRDRLLGTFALHEEFELEIRKSGDPQGTWGPISFEGLKKVLLKEAEKIGVDYSTSTSEKRSEGPCRRIFARIPVEGDQSHFDRAVEAFTQTEIPFQIVGGLDGRGRIAGHVTLAVPSLLEAGKILLRAGFLESPESKYVLLDSQTGWKVRLLQGKPNCFSAS